MKNTSLGAYRIGLGIIGLVTLISLVFVLTSAGSYKADADTYIKATAVADTLNKYVASNLTVPASLAVAGITDAPSSVSYQKLSDTSYKFCVTYKTKSNSFSASNVTSDLTSAALGMGTSSSAATTSSDTYLFLNYYHDKGQNCQTITTPVY